MGQRTDARKNKKAHKTVDQRVEALEAAIASMRGEVRTRRVVVVDQDGNERIDAHVLDKAGEAVLRVNASEDTFVSVVGNPGDAAYAPYAGVWVWANAHDCVELCADESEGERHRSAYLRLGDAEGFRYITRSGDREGSLSAIALDAEHSCGATCCAGILPEDHAWLLDIEAGGFAAAVDLVDSMLSRTAVDAELGQITAADFAEFVASHNWREPARMQRLAEHVTNIVVSKVAG